MITLVALDAVEIGAHAVGCLYKDLCEWENMGCVPLIRTYNEYGEWGKTLRSCGGIPGRSITSVPKVTVLSSLG
jgi:hypothetical protein